MMVERFFAEDEKHTLDDLFKEFALSSINSLVSDYKNNNTDTKKTEQTTKSNQRISI